MRTGKTMAPVGRLKKAERIALEAGALTLDFDVMQSEGATRNDQRGRVLRCGLKLTNVSALLNVPGESMARLMRLRSDGTSDGNALVIQRMLRALGDAAARMPDALTTMGALPEAMESAGNRRARRKRTAKAAR